MNSRRTPAHDIHQYVWNPSQRIARNQSGGMPKESGSNPGNDAFVFFGRRVEKFNLFFDLVPVNQGPSLVHRNRKTVQKLSKRESFPPIAVTSRCSRRRLRSKRGKQLHIAALADMLNSIYS